MQEKQSKTCKQTPSGSLPTAGSPIFWFSCTAAVSSSSTISRSSADLWKRKEGREGGERPPPPPSVQIG